MHVQLALGFALIFSTLACATVAPVSVRVTGAARKAKVAAILPPRFTWPVGGVEVWSAIHHTMQGITKGSRLAMVDPREMDIPKDKSPELLQYWEQANLPAIASRMRLKPGQMLLIEPVIDRRTRQVKIKSGNSTVFAKAADYIITLRLAIGAQPAGAITIRRSLSAMDLAMLDDDMEVWVAALEEACRKFTTEIKSAPIFQVVEPEGMREGLASMASTSLPGLPSPIAIPDTLRRLTEIGRLMRAAGFNLAGSEIEKALNEQPGIRVTRDAGKLKKDDLIIAAEEFPVRNPLTLARLRYFGTVHLEVVRAQKVIRVLLEPQ